MFRLLPFLIALCAFTACRPIPEPLHLRGESMGTTWHVTAYADHSRADELHRLLTERLDAIVQEMSAWEAHSDLSRYNRAAADTWHHFPPDLHLVADFAFSLAQTTGGAYDPTIGPLVALWRKQANGQPRHQPPSAEEITAAQSRIGWQRVLRDPAKAAYYQPGDIALDISSLGPGFGVDAMSKVLTNAGITQFLIELGGEMRASGRKANGDPWRVAVEWPNNGSQPDTVVMLDNVALGTSGDYRVGFEYQGRRYPHTLDPRLGEPVNHTLAAVTVIAPIAMQADAYAAALLVLGPDEGWHFAEQYQLAAVFTLRDNDGRFERRFTPHFEKYLAP